MKLEPRNWELVPDERFNAYFKRQFANESSNINSLIDHHLWSTIKTLPATLPEPRSGVRGPSFEAQGPSFTDNGPAVSDRGPRTGVTGAVSQSDLDIGQGVGADIGCRLLRVGSWFCDWRR